MKAVNHNPAPNDLCIKQLGSIDELNKRAKLALDGVKHTQKRLSDMCKNLEQVKNTCDQAI